MKECDCKHKNYCKVIGNCSLEDEYKHFNEDKIFNMTTKEIAKKQGMEENDLLQNKKEQL